MAQLLDDQADHVGRGDDALRGGWLRAEGPGGDVHPVLRRHQDLPAGLGHRAAGYEWGSPAGVDLAGACDAWASLPLLFQPGSEWNYGVSTDVLGRVVEVVSGQTLDQFLRERIFEPLKMENTAFSAPEPAWDRLAALYVPTPGSGQAVRMDVMGDAAKAPPTFLSGGGGLVSTARDYHRFTLMLMNGGELDGVRLLGSRTAGPRRLGRARRLIAAPDPRRRRVVGLEVAPAR